MQKIQPKFRKKQLVIAISILMVGGAITGCSSSSSKDDDPGTSTPTLGTNTISAKGGLAGNTLTATGGNGGEVNLFNEGASGGVEVRATGSANTAFTSPITAATANLGSNPFNVATDQTLDTVPRYNQVADTAVTGVATGELYMDTNDILRASAAGGVAVYADDTPVADGTLYRANSGVNSAELLQATGDDDVADLATAGTAYLRDNGDYGIYVADGDDTTEDPSATGISVAASATLTIDDNSGCDSRIEVPNDIDNSGTITALDHNCNLQLTANHYLASGSVDVAGDADNTDGGDITLLAVNGIQNNGPLNASGFDNAADDGGNGGGINLAAHGYVLNNGLLDANGGDGMGQGGSGGSIRLGQENDFEAAYVENNGELTARGGNNTADPTVTAGNGGEGGQVEFVTDFVANNTADIDLSGGDGSRGGSGGDSMYFTDRGEAKNSGILNTNGGVGMTDDGGDGGELVMFARGGHALSSGDVNAAGGNTTDATSDGGDGGEVFIRAYGSSSDGSSIDPGDIVVSGNINFPGGDAVSDGSGAGGDGGEVNLSLNENRSNTKLASGQRVALLGYASIDISGGDGARGGDGGEALLETDKWQEGGRDDAPYYSGPAVNEIPINAGGGNSIIASPDSGIGGNGGRVWLFSGEPDNETVDPFTSNPETIDASVSNTANIDVSAGTAVGDINARSGGIFFMWSMHGSSNTGDVNAAGGTGSDFGGDGGEFTLYTNFGPSSNSGILDLSGGDGLLEGDQGGDLNIIAWNDSSSNTGNADISGGSGTEEGNDAGEAIIYGSSSSNTGNIDASGGNASNVAPDASVGGDGGEISITGEGVTTATNSGTLTYSFGTGVTIGEEGCAQVDLTFEGNCIDGPLSIPSPGGRK